jgi:signal transduction histidine kinase
LLDTDRRPIPAGQGPMARAFAGERVRDVEVLLATPGRSARAFSVNGQPILDEGGQRLGAVVALHEVTGRRLAERFTRAELAVSRALATAATAHDAGRAVCEAVAATLAWPHAELWLTDETSQMLKLAASWSAPGRDLRPFRIDTLPRGAGVPGAVWESGQPLWVPDLATDTRFIRARAAAQTGLHVALGAPVRSGNRILGVLAVFGDTVEDPSDALTGLLGGLAAHIGQYLERRRAEELAVALARATDELVALVTHELRSPLAAITTYAEILADETADRLDEGQRRDLDTIRRNAARLSTLINDLLDLARLESGDVSIDLHPLDLCALIREAAETVQTAARAKGLTLSLDLPPHAVVHGDADRLRQVADNMLSNAVKYTPDGGQVSVSVTADDPVEWAVTDTGIGIPPAERHRLFGRFYRASNAQTQRIPGTGLGLAITRTILQRHHGTITLGDHHGPGTTFLITLPVHPRLSPTHTTHPDTATRTGHP